jgi:hypothetical protein
MKKISPEEELDWEQEDYYLEQEKIWRKTLPRLSPFELLNNYPEIIPSLPTILTECEESKRAVERSVLSKLIKARTSERITLSWSLALEEGEKIVKLGEQIKLLTWLIHLSQPHNTNSRKRYTDLSVAKDMALQVPLAQLVSVDVKRKGKNYTCHCSLHNEKTPSFTIFPNNRWYCFGCNEGGDSISFVMRTKKCSFVEAVNYLTNAQYEKCITRSN